MQEQSLLMLNELNHDAFAQADSTRDYHSDALTTGKATVAINDQNHSLYKFYKSRKSRRSAAY